MFIEKLCTLQKLDKFIEFLDHRILDIGSRFLDEKGSRFLDKIIENSWSHRSKILEKWSSFLRPGIEISRKFSIIPSILYRDYTIAYREFSIVYRKSRKFPRNNHREFTKVYQKNSIINQKIRNGLAYQNQEWTLNLRESRYILSRFLD